MTNTIFDRVKERKRLFVQELSSLLVQHNVGSIESMVYRTPGEMYNEEILVTYWGGHTHIVNVSCDSHEAIIRDLVKQEAIV